VVGRGLLEVLETIDGPLVDRRAMRELSEARRAAQWTALTTHPAVVGNPKLADWLEDVRARGMARRLAGDQAAEATSIALDALAALQRDTGGRLLAVLAAGVCGDAHGLDRGRPAGTLAAHALSWLEGQSFPKDAADWRRVWAEAGVACDDLSCDVLVLNLPGWPTEPLRLTLRQASAWRPRPSYAGVVFVSENPAVLAAAADHLADRSPTLVCLDGMPSTAALVILDGLLRCGCTVRYHGDFDWRGITIAGVLARKVPAAGPWRFTAHDYRLAVQRGLGTIPLSGRSAVSPWDPALGTTMESAGVAVYEEQVIDDLLDDLVRGQEDSRPRSTP
jgi:uncharacterized protein (TIGR02679 family)